MEANGTATSDQRPALSCPNSSDDIMEKRWWPKWKKREGEQKGDLKEDGDHTILNRSCCPGRDDGVLRMGKPDKVLQKPWG